MSVQHLMYSYTLIEQSILQHLVTAIIENIYNAGHPDVTHYQSDQAFVGSH